MSSYIPRSLLDQAKPETADPTYRASMLPIGTYPNADGSGEHLGFAVPGMIQEPMNALMRLIGTPSQPGTFTQGPDYGSNSEDMRTLLETFLGGNATRGMGAVERGAVEGVPSLESAFQAYLERRANRKPVVDYQGTPDTNLPMDLPSQLQRANDQGFDTNNVWYHGTPHGSFDAFDLSEVDGRRGSTNNGFRGISMTPNKAEAADYASSARAGAAPTVYALYSKANNPFVWNVDKLPETFKRAREVYPDLLPTGDFPISDRPQFSDALAKAGYDALDVVDRGRLEERAVFDPANIRSINAAFDPANAGKNGLLFSDNLPSLPGAVVAGAERNVLNDPTDFAGAARRAQEMFPNNPIYNRVYRGVSPREKGQVGDLADGQSRLFASTSPDVASTYAPDWLDNGAVFPLDMSFKNPMTVDAGGNIWDQIPFEGKRWSSTDDLADIATQRGHDGLVVRNVIDNNMMGQRTIPGDTYVALKRGTVTSPLTGETLFSDNIPSLPGAVIAGAERNSPGFDVWHGSPHDFDKFDMSKIGTGEGAQVYGRGLYFAENPSVAKGYQDRLSGGHLVNGEPLDFSNPDHVAASLLNDYGPDAAPRVLASDASLNPTQKAAVLSRLSEPEALPQISGDGYLYQARINASPEHFLDWERPLNKQATPVAEAVKQAMGMNYYGKFDPDKAARTWDAFQGAEAGTAVRNGLMSSDPSLLASRLKEAGLPGIRYLDAGSRGAADGSRNYVLFDDNLVNTLHKWRGDQQLYSDQLPSLWSSALQGQQNQPYPNSLFGY